MISKKTCVVRILDEVNCVVIGLNQTDTKYFYEQFGILAPNYFFNPKYKLGNWDGKIRYFQKTGKTYVNLLDEIIPKLISLKYDVKIVDRRESIEIQPPEVDEDFFSNINDDTGNPWKMRPYQVELVNALISNHGGIGIAATGSGKTSMTAAIALSYERTGGLKSIIIVPDKNLTAQTKREFAFFGLNVGEYSGEKKDLDHQHIVSTWQSLNFNPHILHSFQVVIVDECHKIKGNVLSELLNQHGKNIIFRFGVTATLPKEPADALAVKVAVGTVQYSVPAHQLIDKGYLSKLKIDIIQLTTDLKSQYEKYLSEPDTIKLDYSRFKEQYLPEWAMEKQYLQVEKKRLKWIAAYISEKRDAKKGNVLCLVNGVKFGKKLTKLIPDAVFVYGQDSMKERTEVYDLFKKHDNLVVIATLHIASTGLDIKRIFNLIVVDVGRSFIRTIQAIGRGLRRAHDKDFVSVTDICADLKYSKVHVRERIKYYKEAKYPFEKITVDYSTDYRLNSDYSTNML